MSEAHDGDIHTEFETLRKNEQEKQAVYLRLMLENSPNIMFFLDRDGRIICCSKTFLELIAISSVEFVKGRPFEELYANFGDKNFIEQSQERFKRVKTGYKAISENVYIDFSKKGRGRNYSIHSVPILDALGTFDGTLVIYHDITDLLRAEADERARLMFDATPLACTFWSAEGGLLDCNQEALTLFKVPSKEEFIKKFYDLSPVFQGDGSFSRMNIKKKLEETYYTGRKKFEWVHCTTTGEWFPTEVTLVKVKWRDEYRIVGYTRDMRDIKRIEDKQREADARSQELEVQTQAAQVASDAKSKFLASMSHEIRTPMNAIIGMSDLMRTDNLDETQLSFFTDIKKMSKSLLQIINDILDISKIEVGKMEIIPVHFDLMELYDNICSFNRFTAESKNLEWRQSFDNNVPHIIYGDDVRIRQVITNIVNNAIKYTKEGYVDFSVQPLVQNDQKYLAFTVQDTGIGIKQEDFPKLFTTFQQLDSETNRGIIGTGLGLSITKNLVKMMDGEITFESEYGMGSTFKILLPLVDGDPEQVDHKNMSSKVWAEDTVQVLVVDDNSINLKVALASLATHNIHADMAESGMEALQKVQEKPYDLIFMDHMMPEMNGIEVTHRIRTLGITSMPIIALTANAVSGAKEHFLNAGLDDFISKPIDAYELNRTLAKWLPQHKITIVEMSAITERQNNAPASPERDPVSIIDREKGLTNIGGDETLHTQIIEIFKQEHGQDFQKIKDALNKKDITLAHQLAHTLKSTAALLGATGVEHIAYEIESSLQAKNIRQAIQKLPELNVEMDALMQELSKMPATSPEITSAMNKQKGINLLKELQPLLESGNTSSLTLTSEIKSNFLYLGKPIENMVQQLVQQIEDFEFMAALKTAEIIKKTIETS